MLDSPLAACAACSAPSDLAFEWVDLEETKVGVVSEFCGWTDPLLQKWYLRWRAGQLFKAHILGPVGPVLHSDVILILWGLRRGGNSAPTSVDTPRRWTLFWIIDMSVLLVELRDYGWITWHLTGKSFGLLFPGIIAVCDYSVDTWHSATLHWAENSSPGNLKTEGQRCFPLEQLDTSWGFSVGDGWAPPVDTQPQSPQSQPNPLPMP